MEKKTDKYEVNYDAEDKTESVGLVESLPESSPTIVRIDSTSSSHSRCCNGGCFDVKIFLLLVCIFAIVHGFALNGINNVNIPMYERRFKLTSTQTGLQSSFYDFTSCFVLIASGYVVTRFNQPRLLGFAALSLAFGSLVMSLPHFITSDFQPAEVPPSTCNGNSSAEICEDGDKGLRSYLYMFLLGQGLHGIAGALLYTIGPSFIDGSVSDKQSPIYLGIFYLCATFGTCVGYILGGWLLGLYVDIPKAPPPGQTSLSPVWVGAWWVGFLASSAIAFLLAFPLFTFPRVLPGTEERRKNNVSQTHENKDKAKVSRTGFGTKFRDVPAVLLRFAKNPAYVCQCLSGACDGLLLSGLATFTPKFIANQFNVKSGWAGIITGVVAIPSTALGQFLGGFIIKKFKMKVKDIIRMNIGLSSVVLVLTGIYWMHCPQNQIAGVTTNYHQNDADDIMGLEDACNVGCGCDTSSYDPVCLDGVEYFSACHAGCPSEFNSETKRYSKCTCAGSWTNLTDDALQGEATHGKCGNKCYMMYIYLPGLFLGIFFNFLHFVPATTIVLRSVDDSHRTFAIALQQFSVRVLGTIPGPLVFGAILDNVCLIWQDKCEEKGSCWIYNTKQMSQNFFIIIIVFRIISITLTVISYNLYKAPPQEQGADS